MNPKRYTKAMPVKNTNDEMIEVGAMEFADSRIPLMEKSVALISFHLAIETIIQLIYCGCITNRQNTTPSSMGNVFTSWAMD